MRTAHQVTLYVTVYDSTELHEHAASVMRRDMRDTPKEMARQIRELLGTNRKPDLGACLRMIFDPGESPPGCTINDSSHEGGDRLD